MSISDDDTTYESLGTHSSESYFSESSDNDTSTEEDYSSAGEEGELQKYLRLRFEKPVDEDSETSYESVD